MQPYNAMGLVTSYVNEMKSKITDDPLFLQYATTYGMTTIELKIFVEAMRHLVANSFLGGYTQTKKVKDLIFGFEISPATLMWFKTYQEYGI